LHIFSSVALVVCKSFFRGRVWRKIGRETRTNSQKMPLKTCEVQVLMNDNVSGSFKDFAFLPLLGKMIQFD